jgi:ferritin-like metal-binding protein YciE
MSVESLEQLLIHELNDLHNAEKQLVKALPRLAKAASNPKLRDAFNQHLQETKEHVKRLERAIESLDESAGGKKCRGMEGLVKEGEALLKEDMPEGLLDAALIGAARKVEHYEMVAYVSAWKLADALGQLEASSLIRQNYEEEKAADDLLTEIGEEADMMSEAAD